jgi:hypothetical protein
MLRQYLMCTGEVSQLPELDRLQHLMEDTSTKAQFDQVGSLLSDFAGLQLKTQ